ncbi:MAG: UbiA family prenyltransferase [Planctomycetota bacterium]|nr:UbiA family prenyltransferase [Planctomycetota bacterium]
MDTGAGEARADDGRMPGCRVKALDYLRLIRAPNVLTAVADVAAGYLVWRSILGPRPDIARPGDLIRLCAISALVYSAGVVFNDIADLEEDRLSRPFRPLPSGAIPAGSAWVLGSLLMASALVLAMTVGAMCFYHVLALEMIVLLYDFSVKGVPVLGPLAMGTCRAMNLQLGMAASSYFPWGLMTEWRNEALWLPACYLLYVAAITHLSKMEESAGSGAHLRAAVSAAVLAGSSAMRFAIAGPGPWLAVWLPQDAVMLSLTIRCVVRPSTGGAKLAVMVGVFGMPVWAAGLAMSRGPGFFLPGLALVVATPAAFALGRLLRQREA